MPVCIVDECRRRNYIAKVVPRGDEICRLLQTPSVVNVIYVRPSQHTSVASTGTSLCTSNSVSLWQ